MRKGLIAAPAGASTKPEGGKPGKRLTGASPEAPSVAPAGAPKCHTENMRIGQRSPMKCLQKRLRYPENKSMMRTERSSQMCHVVVCKMFFDETLIIRENFVYCCVVDFMSVFYRSYR